MVGNFFSTGGGTIQNSYATGAADGGAGGSDNVGGLVGRSSGTIQNSYATGAADDSGGISGDVGGLVGFLDAGTIQNSYATGAADGGAGASGDVGGLVGRSSGTIQNSYATGAADGGAGGSDNVGGLVGFLDAGTIQNSYATGDVDGGAGDDTIGRLVGTATGTTFTITNSYHSGADTDTDDDFPNLDPHGAARTLAQLRCPSNADLESGAVPSDGFTVPTNADSSCTVADSDSGVMVYDDDSDDDTANGLDGWSRANWDFGTAGELPSVISVGIRVEGQSVTP